MIRFMRLLFYVLVSTTYAVVTIDFVVIIDIGLAMTRQLECYSIFDTYIEISECFAVRQVTGDKRLNIELHALVGRLAIFKDWTSARAGMKIEQTEIHKTRQIHAYFIGIDTELLMLKHVIDTSTYLDMRHDIHIPFKGHNAAGGSLPATELMVNHIIEIIVVLVILAIGGKDRGRGSGAIETHRHFRTHHEIEPTPLSTEEHGDIEIDHVGEVTGFIHADMHIEDLSFGILHRDRLIDLGNTVHIELIHTLHTQREEEMIVQQAIVGTDIGIHTGRSGLFGYIMEQRRVAQIAMEGYEIIELRIEPRLSACAYAYKRQE